MLRRIGSACFLLGIIGCGTDPDEFGRCTGGLQVQAVYAPALQLHWTPADCSMFTVSIDDQGQTLMWYLTATGNSNAIESPLSYGVEPPGTDGTEARNMGPGRYRIVMTRVNQAGYTVLAVDQEFTIPPASSAAEPDARWTTDAGLP